MVFGAKLLDSFVNTLLDNIPGGQLGDIAKGGPITINLGQGIAITLTTVDAVFAPEDNINLKLEAGLKFPFAIDASIPFLSVDIGLDNIQAASTRIDGLNVVGGGTSDLKLGSGVKVHDSDALADRVAAIAAAFFGGKELPGNLVFSGATLGPSGQDAITAFSGVALPLSLNRIAAPFLSGVDRNIDVIAIMERFGLKLGNVNVRTSAGRSMDAGVSASINNIFPLSASVPYLALNVGLDDVDVATTSVADTKITPAAQNLDLKAKLTFPSSKQIQDKVASFASTLLKNGYGSTSESIAASGIVFGVSGQDSITALSKARILIPSKTLITQKNVEVLLRQVGIDPADLTIDGLVKRLDVRGVNLDASVEGKVRVDAAVGLKGLSLSATADLGFAGLTATIDSNK
ncbi:hypothetical protein HDU67_005081 [Dinochytrium kinnereticum]|nr:hypothetical protein HDU67_005081 [Dinochytrium kinnereticum]